MPDLKLTKEAAEDLLYGNKKLHEETIFTGRWSHSVSTVVLLDDGRRYELLHDEPNTECQEVDRFDVGADGMVTAYEVEAYHKQVVAYRRVSAPG